MAVGRVDGLRIGSDECEQQGRIYFRPALERRISSPLAGQIRVSMRAEGRYTLIARPRRAGLGAAANGPLPNCRTARQLDYCSLNVMLSSPRRLRATKPCGGTQHPALRRLSRSGAPAERRVGNLPRRAARLYSLCSRPRALGRSAARPRTALPLRDARGACTGNKGG